MKVLFCCYNLFSTKQELFFMIQKFNFCKFMNYDKILLNIFVKYNRFFQIINLDLPDLY